MVENLSCVIKTLAVKLRLKTDLQHPLKHHWRQNSTAFHSGHYHWMSRDCRHEASTKSHTYTWQQTNSTWNFPSDH